MIKSLIIAFFLFSYSAYSQNIAGNYFPIEFKCKINLKIDANNHFIFNLDKKEIKGILKTSKEDNEIYIDFIDGISGMIEGDTISIQNSGNSINTYLHFKECDEKYIHLVKKNNVNKLKKDENCPNKKK